MGDPSCHAKTGVQAPGSDATKLHTERNLIYPRLSLEIVYMSDVARGPMPLLT
jgi:hypothetical protein